MKKYIVYSKKHGSLCRVGASPAGDFLMTGEEAIARATLSPRSTVEDFSFFEAVEVTPVTTTGWSLP